MTNKKGALRPGSPAGDRERDVPTVPPQRNMPDQRLVVASALSLAWQLALVVIVPIVGGYMLDQHYHKSPIITLAGLVVALIGVFGVLSRLVGESLGDDDGTPGDVV